MSILDVLPGLLQTVEKVTGISNIADIAKALTGNTLPPEQRAAIEQATLAQETQLSQINLDQFKTAMSEAVAEITNPDKYVSRSRPTGLYVFYLVSGATAIGLLLGVKVDPTAILTIIGPLAGVGGTYVVMRSQDKKNANGGSQ